MKPSSTGDFLTLIQMAEAMEQKQMGQRNKGKNRLKMKIDFTIEDPKQVVQSGEIQKDQQSFDQKYKLGDILGEGAHAIVRKCWKNSKNSQQPNLFAVKIFRSGDPEIVTTIKKTYNISRFLHHPAIASTYELYINEKTEIANLVMEFCPYPSLESIIKKRKRLTEEYVKGIAIDLLQAVRYIHKNGVAHRDIKPDNILVNEIDMTKSKIKLVDFGVSKRYLQISPGKVGTEVHDMWTRTGNMYYCAPEIFRSKGHNAAIDNWAVGVVLYQCLTGCLPFHGDTEMDTIRAIQSEKGEHFQTAQFKALSKVCQDFIKRLLRTNPSMRVTAEGALEHPFVFDNRQSNDTQSTNRTRDDAAISGPVQQRSDFLTKSSQVAQIRQTFNSTESSFDYIKEVAEEQDNVESQRKLQSKLNQFKEDNQLTTIQYVKKPQNSNFAAINLEGSYQTFMGTGKGMATSSLPSMSSSNSHLSAQKPPSLTTLGVPTAGSQEIKEDPNEDEQTRPNLDKLLSVGIEQSVMLVGSSDKEYVPGNSQNFAFDLASELGCTLQCEEVVEY